MGPIKARRAVRATALLGLGVVVMMCGCTATSATTPSSAANGLVDIGGRKLEIACRGSGRPVVVLENGLGNTLDVWSQVMERLAEMTTVCASNRAGLGLSDPRPAPHGASSAVDDLHAALAAAHLPSPYVIVGASFGGLDAQLFARRFPDQVVGVVLVDAIAPGGRVRPRDDA